MPPDPTNENLSVDANGCLTERVAMGGLEMIIHYDDIPEDVRSALEFVWLERIDEAVEAGLEPRDSEAFTAADRGH